MENPSLKAFREARDFLIKHREDYEAAYHGFRWPSLDRFNWALDWFDVIAKDNNSLALRVFSESGEERSRTFSELSEISSRIANSFARLGVKRGDRILLMLVNRIELWETMLAAMKLGAVVTPATSQLTASDLQDRFERGGVRHVITDQSSVEKFDSIAKEHTRIVIDGPVKGWEAFDALYSGDATLRREEPTKVDDPILLYFTSGTTAKPKLVLHTHRSYAVGHLSTMYWIGLRPDDIHWNISSPGWAKHAWSCFFAPWNAGACVFIYNYARFDAKAMLTVLERCRVTTMCAPPTVWRMLIQEDLAAFRGRLAIRELIGAGEPLNPEIIDRVQDAWGITVRDGFGQTETTA